MNRAETPRRARLWHLWRLARILWAAEPRTAPRARIADLHVLSRLIWRGQVIQVPGRLGPRGFLARDGARIHALYTHPRARRRGVGTRLLRQAQHECPRLELWTAQDNHAARRLYDANGFYPVAQSFGQGNDAGMPDVRLIWQRNT